MKIEILVAIIAAVPVIIAPIVGWIISRFGLGRQFRELDIRAKQLEILEKATKLSNTKAQGNKQTQASLDKAVSETLNYIAASEKRLTEQESLGYKSLNRLNRFLLLFKPYSKKGWTFRALYYLSLYMVVVFPFVILSGVKDELFTMVPVYLVYLFLAFIFHRIAVNDAKDFEAKLKKTRTSPSKRRK